LEEITIGKYAKMKTLLFVGLLGVFSYHCMANWKEFRGASGKVEALLAISGSIGYTAYYAMLIICFWHFAWWKPIVTAIASIVFGGFSGIFFQKSLVGMMLSPILVLVFLILSIVSFFI
jgi:hypothetical protein